MGAETLTESKRTGRVVDGISVTVDATNATVLETGVTVNQMSSQVHEMQEMLENLVVSANEERQDVRQDPEALQRLTRQVLWPSNVDSARESFDKIDKAQVPGTGDWVHREEVFQSWINKETPVIFVSGNPGSGKSFLAANMIKFLFKQFPPELERNPQTSIGYFFFNGGNPQTRSFHQALRDLAFQISKNDLGYQRYLATIEDHERISTLESAWRLLFVEYFLKTPNVESTAYILLDAVDEALDEEWITFIDLAKELYGNQSCLQLAIVGRPYISDQLLEALEVKVPTLHVNKQKNSGDIVQYIHASIKKSLILRKVSAKLRNEIIDKLSAGAEGMFLWVKLMLQELAKKRNETSMRKAMEQAPRGLREMLRHVLATFSERSNPEELEYLNETLLWVTCAGLPWRLDEIETILRLKSPEGDGMIDLEGALRRQWASFFSLDREDGLTTAELENGSVDLDAFDLRTDEEKQEEYDSSEEDFFVAFNSKGNTTTVTFCHASISDFFRDESEGKVSASRDHILVGVDYGVAKIHILKTYLRLITDPDFAAKANDSEYMLRHAARHWSDDLLTTLPHNCSSEDRREVAKMLLGAFLSEESMSSWIGESNWVLSTDIIKGVQQWWQEQDVREHLSSEEKEFVSSTEENRANLFKPIAKFCVKKWFWEDFPNLHFMVPIIWRYQMLVKGEEVHDHYEYPTAEEVINAAEFGGFEKTSQWFRRCAIGLRQSGYHKEALQYFTRAMELNRDDWKTLRELAQTYQEQREWEEAIKLWHRTRLILLAAIADSPEDQSLKGHIHDCLEHMGEIYNEQEDREKRFEVIQEAYQYAPSCWNCIYVIIEHHNANQAYEVTMDLLKKLADTPVIDEDFSELTQFFLVNVFDVDIKSRNAADAALATNELDFVLESLQTAAREARGASRTLIAAEVDMAIARIYNEYLFDRMMAIRCWEKIMDTYSSSSEGTLIGMIRQLASSNLAQAFLCNALEAGVGTPEAEESVTKLEKLVQQSESSRLGSWAFVPAVYLGMYHRFRGQDEQARALFRPPLQQIVQTIGDNNPSNEELSELKYTLIRAGDLKNAIAIVHRSEDNSDGKYICHGPCKRKALTRDGFFICPICIEGELCPDCVKLLGSAIQRKRCHSQHVKYFISISPQSKETSSGSMLVDGVEMEFETWLNKLKKEWVLNTHNPSRSTAGQFGFSNFALGFVA